MLFLVMFLRCNVDLKLRYSKNDDACLVMTHIVPISMVALLCLQFTCIVLLKINVPSYCIPAKMRQNLLSIAVLC